jgi:hypothetical protein
VERSAIGSRRNMDHGIMPARSDAENVAYYKAQIMKSARLLLASGGVVEDGLDAVLTAVRHEFNCRIVALRPATLRIDGADFTWPINDENK